MASRYGFKMPRTTQEARMSEAHDEYVRPRRNANNLPHFYDDRKRARQPRSDRYKNHR